VSKKYLLIGPRNLLGQSDITGGVVVLFEDLISYCEEHDLQYDVIDTNKSNYKNKLFAYIIILYLIIKRIPKFEHISLHGTANDYLFIAPFAIIFAKFFNKTISLRKFAGNFIDIYNSYFIIKRKTIDFTLRNSDINFFETKYLVKYFKKFNTNTFWFPNVRKKQVITTDSVYKSKFIFVGSVNEKKGIEILCKASNLLTKKYTIDIYGMLDEKYTESFFDDFNVNYKGRLRPENVAKVMSEYDVLVLPTFWQGEGYPGVIIEALSVGLPIIATNLDGITEMLDDTMSDLINPHDIRGLSDAILSITPDIYSKMSQKAHKRFELFDSQIKTKLFFERINNVES